MAALKARCPICGGTIIIPEGKNLGECDSCATQFSLSDLQRMREQTSGQEHAELEGRDIDGDGLIDYTTALSIDNITHETVAELCKKAEIALGAEKWSLVYSFCDEIIRRDPRFAKAYLYKLLADSRIYSKEALAGCERPFDTNANYRLLMRFADTYLSAEIANYLAEVKERLAERQRAETYERLCEEMKGSCSENVLRRLIKGFHELGGYRDSALKKQECEEKLKALKASNTTKKSVTIIVFLLIAAAIVGGIVGIICAIVGAVSSHNAGYDKSLFEVKITDKTNEDYDDSIVRVIFDFDFTNNTTHPATKIVGYLKVKDSDGNILTNGEATFEGEFRPGILADWTLRWRMSRDEDSAELWNSRFELLEIQFAITELRFEDGTTRTYEIEEIVVKPFDTAYAEERYTTAMTHFNNGKYAEAQEIFEKLQGYKDSEDKATECKNVILQKDNEAKEAKYQAATEMLDGGNYVGAVKLLNELGDYRDSAEVLELIRENVAEIALEYSVLGGYRQAVELIEGVGYSPDSWDIPDDVYYMLRANKEALEGSYAELVELGISDFVIPEGTTKIEDYAFQNATGLKSVKIPTSVTAIGAYAFYGCTAITSVSIPEGVTSIDDYAFYSCSSLYDISLPESLRTIGARAFSYCRSMTSIELPSGITSLGSEAFSYCTGLNKLTIPNSVTFIGSELLERCNGITEVTMPIVEGFTVKSLFDYQIPSSFIRVTLTKGTILGYHYFYNCTTLVEINLPEGLLVIGEESLAYCSATTVNIPDSVKEIKNGAFKSSSITSLTLPISVTEIPDNMLAFSKIKTLNLHSGVKSIGASVFQDCSPTINYDGKRAEWEDITKDSLWNYSLSGYAIVCTDATYTYKYGTGSWA